jgi:hypothetical protein
MQAERRPGEIIRDLANAWRGKPDEEVLAALHAIPPLADEHDATWEDEAYWVAVAYPYLALADVVAERGLCRGMSLLLERASFGDPGEIMRGLRHNLEAIAKPDWEILTDVCLLAARSERRGTRLWAIDQLVVLDDPRAKPVFEEALHDGSEEIRSLAEVGLARLAASRQH